MTAEATNGAACTVTGTLPEWPRSWYWFCPSHELGRKPLGKACFSRELVAFRTARNQVGVMLARCAHMGAQLAGGDVVGERLRCSFHHWEFDVSGQCQRIPMSSEIPAFARQTAFPTVERHGNIYFFNGALPAFELPFFEGCTEADLVTAPPFTLMLECPWYMIGANGVDVQHFQTTHDREMAARPVIEHPTPFTHQTINRFRIVGQHLRDRLTRSWAGPEVEMKVQDWAGTMFFVHATFHAAQTFGRVSMLPIDRNRTLLQVSVSVRRSENWAKRVCWDSLNARVRRYFIKKFLEPDVARSAGTRYNADRLIAADHCLAEYFAWLRQLHGPAVFAP